MVLSVSHSDEYLLTLLQGGEAGAFTRLYERYWQRMFAMAFLRLERRDLAEDIVQEVFTRLWQNRQTLRIQSLESWLATAIKYQVIDLTRRRLQRELSTETLPETTDEDRSLDIRFLEQQVALEINKLPEKCRLVFVYHHEHGYSNRAIADELQLSEKTVEKHITTARKKLAFSLRSLLHSLFSFL